jgi:hypothetical protein
MATGESLWESQHEQMKPLKEFAKSRILPFTSSSHYTENMIRDTSLVATTGRGEAMRSALVLGRQTINPLVAKRTVPSRKAEEGTIRPPRGCARNEQLAVRCLEVVKKATEYCPNKKKRKEVEQGFRDSSNNSKKARVDSKMETYKQAPERAPNKIMREQGVDRTAAVQGKVDMTELKANQYRVQVQAELEARDPVPDSKWPLLKKQMREAEGITEGKVWFTPKTEFFKNYLLQKSTSADDSDDQDH